MDNLYDILGVSRQASPQEIRAAFRRRARQCHPDVSPSPTATDDFLRIAEAYRILSDRRLKSMYDQGVLLQRESYLRRKLDQRLAEQYFDHLVNDLLKRDEEETKARQVAVTTVVSLFFSTFIVALLRPPIFDMFGWSAWGLCLGLFVLGVRELFLNVKASMKYFTDNEESTISIMHPHEGPYKPYTREEAWAFLIGGYFISVALGLLISSFIDGGPRLNWASIVSVFLVPPVFVYLVGRVRAIGLFEIKRIETR